MRQANPEPGFGRALFCAPAGAQDYITIRLTDVIVTSVALADTAVDAQPPVETVGLGFAKVEGGYRPQKADGSLGAPVEFKFDLKKNRPF